MGQVFGVVASGETTAEDPQSSEITSRMFQLPNKLAGGGTVGGLVLL